MSIGEPIFNTVIIPDDFVPIPDVPPTDGETDTGGVVASPGVGGNATANATTQLYGVNGVKQMVWAQEPFRVLWIVRTDGMLVGLTYRRDQGVFAWHRHPFKNGAVESVTVIPDGESGEDQVWLLVRRTIDGQQKKYVEVITQRHTPTSKTDVESFNYLDSSLEYNNPGVPITSITGLSHLEGEEVTVFANGVAEGKYVVSSGSITISTASDRIFVGIGYTSYFKTLRFFEDAAQARPKGAGRISLRVVDTIGAMIGNREDNMEILAATRIGGDLFGSPANLITADVISPFNGGWSTEGQFVVGQTAPLPLTVTSLTASFDQGDL